jgi:hypothetical protein
LRSLHISSVCLALLGALAGSSAYAQSGSTLSGRVVKDGAPLAGSEVALHQVTAARSGMIGQTTTGPGGSFAFALPPADTASFNVFFVTVDHLGVRYFGAPVHRGEIPATYDVAVFDTTSALPGAVRVSRRSAILFPETDGSWSANELVRVVNNGGKTIIAGPTAPSFGFSLPEGATDFEVTEGDVASQDLTLVGRQAVFVGNLIPGPRELFIRYRLPGDQSAVEIQTSGVTDTFDVFIPEAFATATVRGLATTRVTTVENERFVQYTGTDLPAEHVIRIAWSATGPPVSPVAAALVVVAVVLAVGAWLAYRNRDGFGAAGPIRRQPAGT